MQNMQLRSAVDLHLQSRSLQNDDTHVIPMPLFFASVCLFDTFYPHLYMWVTKDDHFLNMVVTNIWCTLRWGKTHVSYKIEKGNAKRLKTVIWRNRKPEMQDLRIRFDISTSGFNNLIIFRSNLQSLHRSRIRRFRYKKIKTKSHSFVLTPHNKFSPTPHTCSQHIWKTKKW